MLPDVVELDEWGYPMVTGEIPPGRLAAARRAAAACPKLALRIRATGNTAGTRRMPRGSTGPARRSKVGR